jgi:hypothetical protein
MNHIKRVFLLIFVCSISMQHEIKAQNDKPKDQTSTNVLGFGMLKRLPGLWNGPVYSSTSAGSFDKWYVDFRPVSAGQISQYSMLDSQTVNITSFFIVKHNGQHKVAMRTEGCFAQKCCVTYEVMDSVNEAKGYYRFSDFQSGTKRAYTEFVFTENQFEMDVFTTKFNKVQPLQLHTKFVAKLASRKAAEESIAYFNYPQPVMVKDFTGVFANMTESIFFDLEYDPYNSSSQPHLGNVIVNISIDPALKTKKTDEVCLLLTTEPLFEGLKYNPENLKYLSKYAYLPVDVKSITIKNTHPGKYYLYSFSDLNNDKKHLKGDYMSSTLNNVITVPANGNVTVETKIDLVIP